MVPLCCDGRKLVDAAYDKPNELGDSDYAMRYHHTCYVSSERYVATHATGFRPTEVGIKGVDEVHDFVCH